MQLEGVRVRLDDVENRGHETLYAAMGRGETLSALVMGVEQDEVLGECLVVSVPGTGDIKGLIPQVEVGQMPWRRLSSLIGREVLCRVVSVDRRRAVVLLSRKVVQEWQAERTWGILRQHEAALAQHFAEVKAARQELAAARQVSRQAHSLALEKVRLAEHRWRESGPEFDAVVRRVAEWGALVDIGGVLARLSASEVEYGPVVDCRERLKPGYGFHVRVLAVNSEAERVWVSRRAMLPDPWRDVAAQYKEGGIYLGTVALIRASDVVVELRPGIAVLVDRYTLGPAAGARVRVLIRRIFPDRRRMFGRVLSVVDEPA